MNTRVDLFLYQNVVHHRLCGLLLSIKQSLAKEKPNSECFIFCYFDTFLTQVEFPTLISNHKKMKTQLKFVIGSILMEIVALELIYYFRMSEKKHPPFGGQQSLSQFLKFSRGQLFSINRSLNTNLINPVRKML